MPVASPPQPTSEKSSKSVLRTEQEKARVGPKARANSTSEGEDEEETPVPQQSSYLTLPGAGAQRYTSGLSQTKLDNEKSLRIRLRDDAYISCLFKHRRRPDGRRYLPRVQEKCANRIWPR